MRMRSCLSSVVLAVASVSLTPAAHAVDLVWDMDPATAGVQDGNGTWDLTALNWVNAGSNGAWINGSNAVFGSNVATASNLAPYNVSLGAAIVVQDLRLNGGTATGALGQVYSIDDDAGGSLQLNGNVIKNSAGGNPLIRLANGLTLGAGNHVFTLRDTGGDALPELRIQGVISGSGSVTLDNSFGGSGYESWGGLNFTRDNTYTGQTFISDGRLGITRANGLGASGAGQGTIINAIGTLAIGGGGQLPTSNLTINEPITVSRSAYTGAFDNGAGITGDAGTYNSAIFTYNGSGTTTFNDLTVDSNDVRLRAETSTLVVANNIKIGPNATTPSISVTGDFAGFVHLTGNNTALTGGVSIISSVQLDVDNDNQIGGASAPLNFVAAAPTTRLAATPPASAPTSSTMPPSTAASTSMTARTSTSISRWVAPSATTPTASARSANAAPARSTSTQRSTSAAARPTGMAASSTSTRRSSWRTSTSAARS